MSEQTTREKPSNFTTDGPLLIYVAGPYRSWKGRNVLEHIRIAEAAAMAIWRLGHYALCPHKNAAHFEGIVPDSRWLKGDLDILRRCDGICMAGTWSESPGAQEELRRAIEWGLRIFWSVDDIDPFRHHEDGHANT